MEYYVLVRDDEYKVETTQDGGDPLYGNDSWNLKAGPFPSWEAADASVISGVEKPMTVIEWVDASVILPPRHRTVLVVSDSGGQMHYCVYATYDKTSGWTDPVYDEPVEFVTYWANAPDLPKRA